MNRKQSFLMILAIAISFPAQADWRAIRSNEFSLPPPPEEGSAKYREDFEILLQYQQNRSKADCDLSRSQKYPDFDSLYGSSELLSRSEMRAVGPLIDKSMNLMERISDYFKGKFQRARPYSTDNRIQPCVEPPSGAKSYPSSHAAMATIGACILKEIFPSKASELQQYADYLAELRVIVGVHHPSDIQAGKLLAYDLCEKLSNDEEFMQELRALK